MRRMFSEKQVKDLVNQGIEDGEISIPSGGTKLYKHRITFNVTIDNVDTTCHLDSVMLENTKIMQDNSDLTTTLNAFMFMFASILNCVLSVGLDNEYKIVSGYVDTANMILKFVHINQNQITELQIPIQNITTSTFIDVVTSL